RKNEHEGRQHKAEQYAELTVGKRHRRTFQPWRTDFHNQGVSNQTDEDHNRTHYHCPSLRVRRPTGHSVLGLTTYSGGHYTPAPYRCGVLVNRFTRVFRRGDEKMRLAKIASLCLLLSACTCLLLTPAFAQYRASLQGTVTDAQGAVVAGAKVNLTDLETSRALQATTNSSGVYSFTSLSPSRYRPEVEKEGFKKTVLDELRIIAEQSNAADVQLSIGEAAETVQVNADAAPAVDTETANISGTVTAKQIEKLPSFGRDVFQLLQLAPGAFGDGSRDNGGGTANLPATTIGGTGATSGVFNVENGGQIVANGARTGENNYQLDGVGVTSVSWGGTSVITPNEDSIKEVKVLTNNYDAENG